MNTQKSSKTLKAIAAQTKVVHIRSVEPAAASHAERFKMGTALITER